jgi:hypothetical protein
VIVTGIGHQPWGVIGMAVLLIVGILSLAYAGTMRETTGSGQAEAAPWRGYQAGLEAAKHDTAHGGPQSSDALRGGLRHRGELEQTAQSRGRMGLYADLAGQDDGCVCLE